MTLSELAAEYAAAKEQEARATQARRDIGALIQALTGHESEGQKTYRDGDWKVTVKAPLVTTMDWAQWETVKQDIPEEIWPIEAKTVLDMNGVKWIAENDPAAYAILAQCLTTKPGAVQISVAQQEH